MRLTTRLVPFVLVGAVEVFGGTAARAGQTPDVISEARWAANQEDFARGEHIIAEYRSSRGTTPEMLEALSWLGRGALAAQQWDRADAYARQTHVLAREALKGRRLDQEPHLPIALGAAIEVQAQVSAARGSRGEAIAFLRRELDTYRGTSLVKRIQKNILLLSLEGQPAPALDVSEYVGRKPPTIESLRGNVALLFFWAHWCGDCKLQAPVLEKLASRYGDKGLVIVAPTQRYGFVARGDAATPAQETPYIGKVLETHYEFLAGRPVPLSKANHEVYGVSTTPTLVLVDRDGIVRLYHPGWMGRAALEPLIRRLIDAPAGTYR